jgi:hypothetical protein
MLVIIRKYSLLSVKISHPNNKEMHGEYNHLSIHLLPGIAEKVSDVMLQNFLKKAA